MHELERSERDRRSGICRISSLAFECLSLDDNGLGNVGRSSKEGTRQHEVSA